MTDYNIESLIQGNQRPLCRW